MQKSQTVDNIPPVRTSQTETVRGGVNTSFRRSRANGSHRTHLTRRRSLDHQHQQPDATNYYQYQPQTPYPWVVLGRHSYPLYPPRMVTCASSTLLSSIPDSILPKFRQWIPRAQIHSISVTMALPSPSPRTVAKLHTLISTVTWRPLVSIPTSNASYPNSLPSQIIFEGGNHLLWP